MPSPEYTNLYTFNSNLGVEDLSNDFYLLKNYISDHTNPLYPTPDKISSFTNTSFIQFDNLYTNLDKLDLSYRNIYNTNVLSFSKNTYKYIQILFNTTLSFNNFQLLDSDYNPISFKYNSSDISYTSINIFNSSSLLIEPDPIIQDFPKYIRFDPIVTDKLIYSDPTIPLIKYYTYNNSTKINSTIKEMPSSDMRNVLAAGAIANLPTTAQPFVEKSKVFFRGDISDNFYTLSQFNDHLFYNIFGYTTLTAETAFKQNAIEPTSTQHIYNITFTFNDTDTTEEDILYIDLSSSIFSILGITLSDISGLDILSNSTGNYLELQDNIDVSFNFRYFPYQPLTIGYNNYDPNGTYINLDHSPIYINDKSSTNVTTTHPINYTIPMLSFDQDNIINTTYRGSQLNVYDLSSIFVYSNYYNSNFIDTNHISSINADINLTNSNIFDTSYCYTEYLYIDNSFNLNSLANITIQSNCFYIDSSFNINYYTPFNLNKSIYLPYCDNDNDKNYIKLFNHNFIKYNSNNSKKLIITKNIFINTLFCNDISTNNLYYVSSDISLNNIDVSQNTIINNNLSVNIKDISGITNALEINSSGVVKTAYYVNQRTTNTEWDGYRMEIGPYPVNHDSAGWYIKMLGESNKYCKKNASIGLIPNQWKPLSKFKDIHGNSPYPSPSPPQSIFFIDSDYITYSGNLTRSSDIRLKKNINPINHAINIIDKIKPVTYYRSNHINYNDATQFRFESGFIAQDIQDIDQLQHLVYKNSESSQLFLNYTSMQPFFTKALQELQNEINSIKSRIHNLDN
tara:strand:+ start:2771 stop:5155 length:2385 start_codon:yes stop_codon:yes gene_type:complete